MGRRRLKAARQAGISSVEVRIVHSEVPGNDGYVLAFWDNAVHRICDPASKAVVVRRLLELFPRQVVAQEFLPILGVAPLGPRLERMIAIGSLEEPILAALAAGGIHEKTAAILATLGIEERQCMIELLDRLGMNANKNAEIVSNLHDLCIFHGKTVREFTGAAEVRAILEDENLPLAERAKRFRHLVRSWKFPELVARESEFGKWLRHLPERDNIRIIPAPSFESDRCTIEVQAPSREDAEQILGRLSGGETE